VTQAKWGPACCGVRSFEASRPTHRAASGIGGRSSSLAPRCELEAARGLIVNPRGGRCPPPLGATVGPVLSRHSRFLVLCALICRRGLPSPGGKQALQPSRAMPGQRHHRVVVRMRCGPSPLEAEQLFEHDRSIHRSSRARAAACHAPQRHSYAAGRCRRHDHRHASLFSGASRCMM